MKFHWMLLAVLLALCGCHSDLYYQEQAVESARKFIYEHARELTPEQFAYVRLTPPVLLTGGILGRNERNRVRDSLAGGEKLQICITWRVPGQETDYMVFGMSEPAMAYWRPLRLIRRRIGKIDARAQAAMTAARKYAMSALYEQLSATELNRVRFTHPELLATSFPLDMKGGDIKEIARPWKRAVLSEQEAKEAVQLTLCWKLDGGRTVFFCGMGKDDLSNWKIMSAGITDAAEMKKSTVKSLRTPDTFLLRTGKVQEPAKKAEKNGPAQNQKNKPARGGK